MRYRVRCLLCSLFLLCSFQCEQEVDRFEVTNMTSQTVVIHAVESEGAGTIVNAKLGSGESVKIYSHQGAPARIYIMYLDVSLYIDDGTLLRYWTRNDVHYDEDEAIVNCFAPYFKWCGVRQFYDEREWRISKSGKNNIHTFSILPEDLVPLSEILERTR